MAGIRKSKKTSIESTIEDQLKELKDLFQETNQKVTSLETKISSNHSKLLGKTNAVDKNAKEGFCLNFESAFFPEQLWVAAFIIIAV